MCPDFCLCDVLHKQPLDRLLLEGDLCYPELQSAFPVQGWAAHTQWVSGLCCWSHKPGWHVQGAAAVVIIYNAVQSWDVYT